MSIFDRLFSRPDATEGDHAPPLAADADRFVPRYPPVDEGLPVVAPEDMLRTQGELIRRLKITSGVGDSDFDALYLDPLRALAAFVQLLPASRDYHHHGPGGAFRFALETAFYALQASEGAIFTGYDTPERRREIEPKWRYATFLAGLSVDLYVPLTDMLVVDPAGRHTWSPFEAPLFDFCREHHIKRYLVRWQPVINHASDTDVRARASVAAFAVNQVIPNLSVRHICSANPRILAAMMASITGQVRPGDHNSLHQLVAQARADMISRDRKAQPDLYGRFQIGGQLEPHLIDAMRTLVKSGRWPVNEASGAVYVSAEGAFVRWPEAADELTAQLQESGVRGAPRDADLLAGQLVEAGIAQPFIDQENRKLNYWQVFVAGETLPVLRLSSVDLLFPRDKPKPMEFEVLSPAELADQVTSQIRQGLPPEATQAPAAEAVADSTAPAEAVVAAEEAPAPWVVALEQMGLEEPVRMLLQAIGEFVRETGADDQVKWVDGGLAIAVPLIKDFGFEEDRIVQSLMRTNWLHIDPARPGRIKHPVEFGDTRQSCILLQEKIGLLIKERAA